MTGTDLTQVDGIDVMAVMTVVSEVGWDMSKWKTENHFVCWLKLSPDNKISGGKVIGKGRMPTNNRATTVLRMAATTLRESEERQLFRGTVPPTSDSAGASGGSEGHGRQTRPAHIPHAALRNEICEPRIRVVRGTTPQTAGYPPQAKSRPVS